MANTLQYIQNYRLDALYQTEVDIIISFEDRFLSLPINLGFTLKLQSKNYKQIKSFVNVSIDLWNQLLIAPCDCFISVELLYCNMQKYIVDL